MACAGVETDDRPRRFTLVKRIDLRPGQVTISIDPAALAAELGIAQSDPLDQRLQIKAPFQSRKRGVETKLILGAEMQQVDQTLLANLAKAQVWLEHIKSGKNCDAIAASAGTSKRRVQQMLDLAFLAPNIAKSIVEGRQPLGLTSDWLKRHRLPTRWQSQRAIVSTL